MDEVDFAFEGLVVNHAAIKELLGGHSHQEHSFLASRAALRIMPYTIGLSDLDFQHLALPVCWAVLVSSTHGSGRTQGLDGPAAYSEVVKQNKKATKARKGTSVTAAAIHAASSAANAAGTAAFASASQSFSMASIVEATESAATSGTRETVNAATKTDFLMVSKGQQIARVWGDLELPKTIGENHLAFLAQLSQDEWPRFFHDWYLGMWEGTWTDWPLAHEVAKIDASVWEEGLEAVAAEIHEIEKRLGRQLPRPDNVPELERKKLIEHVKTLLASPEMTALAAEGAAETLNKAIEQYLKEAPANCLPDELAHLQDLPKIFRQISSTVKSSERAEVRERKLAEQITALNAKVADLEAKLKDARGRTVNGLFMKVAITAAGGAFGLGVMSSLGLAVSHFFGEMPSDVTLENLRGWLSDLQGAEPKVEPSPQLPPATDA